MDTRQFEKNVAAYVEGLLDEKTMLAMEVKRAECAECDNLARLHENILKALDSTEPVKAPPGLEQRILAAIEAEDAEASALQKTRRKALAVSLSTAAVLLAGLVPFLAGALEQGAEGAAVDAAYGWAIAGSWWAGVKSLLAAAATSDQWALVQLVLHYLTQRIEIANLPIAFPGYFFLALGPALAAIIWVTRDYFGNQQKLVLSSTYRRGLI
ncbi:MAG: hypothetical protein JXQ83_14615 [Candidatus Glassbacteria bacterium]|nr:hypothetical protein [Candidatus Glassbacteria bacterium]